MPQTWGLVVLYLLVHIYIQTLPLPLPYLAPPLPTPSPPPSIILPTRAIVNCGDIPQSILIRTWAGTAALPPYL